MAWNMGLMGAVGTVAIGDFELLETTTLTSATSSVTFTSLTSTYASKFNNLQIRVVGRAVVSSGVRSVVIQFNNDTGLNYDSGRIIYDGSIVESNAFTNRENNLIGAVTGSTSPANSPGANIIDIFDPFDTSKNTTLRSLFGMTGNVFNGMYVSNWADTSSVDVIKVYMTADFEAGTRISLYGYGESA